MSRTALIAASVGPLLLALAWGAWNARQLQLFLRNHPELSSSWDLAAFKRMAAAQMRAALIQIALLLAPFGAFAWGLHRGILRWSDLGLVLIPVFLVGLLGAAIRGVEKRVQTLPANDPLLAAERDAVVKCWKTKPLPNWTD